MRIFINPFILLCICFQACFSFEAERNLHVKLNRDDGLFPIYVTQIENPNSLFAESYVRELKSILQFDLSHNGITAAHVNDAKWEGVLHNPEHYTEEMWKSLPYEAFISLTVNQQGISGTLGRRSLQVVRQFEGLPLTGNLNEDRKTIHQIADSFSHELFQQPGIASSRILYTLKSSDQSGKWISDIWEADYDGHNPRKILEGAGYCVTPSYIPAKSGYTNGSIIYTSYKNGQPKIYVSQINEGIGRRLSLVRGNQLMPVVSRQRDKMAFICDVAGNPDLFVQAFSLEKGLLGKPQQVFANGQAAQGTPTFSPDGTSLAFVSNKDGTPRIYLIDLLSDQKKPQIKLLTKYSRESTAPSWSPDGTKIAYSSLTQGVRQIWIYDLINQEEKQVTFGKGHKENPSWAPNSQMLIYNCTDQGSSQLYLIGLKQAKPTRIGMGDGEKHYPSWGV